MHHRLLSAALSLTLVACTMTGGEDASSTSSGGGGGSTSGGASSGGGSSGSGSGSGSTSSTSSGGSSSSAEPTQSVISGRVLAPSGTFGLFDALVSVDYTDEDGVERHKQTHTRFDGQFFLRGLPPGTYTVKAERGRYTGTGAATIDDPLSQVTGVDIRVLAAGARFVVVTGSYDSIEDIIGTGSGGLGFNPVIVDGSQDWGADPPNAPWVDEVATPEYLANVDALFLNCGLGDDIFSNPNLADRRQALLDWIAAGGGLYASDWAYDVVEWLFPDPITFLGDDLIHGDAQQGDSEIVTATMVDETLEKIVGRTVEINYDLPAWAVIEEATTSNTVSVLATGTVHAGVRELEEVPLAVRIRSGEGTVIYTTFHNEVQLDETVRGILNYIVMSL
ncbi:MAG: carboxypeptidase-like regulatory domain-containing protein [Myxococcota bacterium]